MRERPAVLMLTRVLRQVGMVAINDGIILESCLYRILKLHFRWSQN